MKEFYRLSTGKDPEEAGDNLFFEHLTNEIIFQCRNKNIFDTSSTVAGAIAYGLQPVRCYPVSNEKL